MYDRSLIRRVGEHDFDTCETWTSEGDVRDEAIASVHHPDGKTSFYSSGVSNENRDDAVLAVALTR